MKALLVHLAATAFVILAALFIIGDGKTDSCDRFLIVFFLIILNALVALFCSDNNYYGK